MCQITERCCHFVLSQVKLHLSDVYADKVNHTKCVHVSMVKLYTSEPYDVRSVKVKTYFDFLTVAWEPPISGRVERYTAELKYVAGSRKVITDLSNRTAKFVSLKSGKPYTVLVIAVSGFQKSIAVEEVYYTSKWLPLT